MSKAQQDDAEKIIDEADNDTQHDSLTVLQIGLYKLQKLGLNTYDFARYKRRLEQVAGVK